MNYTVKTTTIIKRVFNPEKEKNLPHASKSLEILKTLKKN